METVTTFYGYTFEETTFFTETVGNDVEIELVPMCVIGTIGALGNGLVLVVLLRIEEYRNRLGNLLVIHQSLVDFLASLLCMVTYISKSKHKSYQDWGILYCWLLDSEIPMWTLLNLSTCNLMAITVERYLMVVFPVFHRKHVSFKVIMADIVFLWALAMSVVGGFCYPFSGVLDSVCYLQRFWPNVTLASFYSAAYFIFYFLVPVLMFIICYGHMMCIMHRTNKIGPQFLSLAQRKQQRVQINLTKVMIIVCLCFVICWGPLLVHYLLMCQGLVPGLQLSGLLYRILSYLSFANSCINPFVYAFKYEDFKKGTKKLFGCKEKTQVSIELTSTTH